MSQIQKGTIYATGDVVSAGNLNAHVDNAILLAGAITDQIGGIAAPTDLVLVSKAGVLNQVTAGSIAALVDTSSIFLRSDGTSSMDSGVNLTLGTSVPVNPLHSASKSYVDNSISEAGVIPTGGIMTFYRSTAPAGWLECNGSVIASTGDTAALYVLIGATLPDLRGEFVRGWDHGKGTDSGRTLGSFQADNLKSHAHSYNGLTANAIPAATGTETYFATGSLTTGTTGGTETRPRNVAFMYCIKK